EKLVYITDTGFVPNRFKPYLQDADYYIFESNYDIGQLLQTRRPMFVKQRILSDNGHLCNEDSAKNLSQIVNTHTKEIVLAHLSQEANHPQLAMDVTQDTFRSQSLPLSGIRLRAAGQFEVLHLGHDNKE
ncbi:MAG: MBL fold metallo-hydrolase, partial [Erysipelotrichaceae bacterium]|nr:MBL fold metallo-hydrolase [Erysipelotrichaceae bacterium]